MKILGLLETLDTMLIGKSKIIESEDEIPCIKTEDTNQFIGKSTLLSSEQEVVVNKIQYVKEFDNVKIILRNCKVLYQKHEAKRKSKNLDQTKNGQNALLCTGNPSEYVKRHFA